MSLTVPETVPVTPCAAADAEIDVSIISIPMSLNLMPWILQTLLQPQIPEALSLMAVRLRS
jgi:hypothetical protein